MLHKCSLQRRVVEESLDGWRVWYGRFRSFSATRPAVSHSALPSAAARQSQSWRPGLAARVSAKASRVASASTRVWRPHPAKQRAGAKPSHRVATSGSLLGAAGGPQNSSHVRTLGARSAYNHGAGPGVAGIAMPLVRRAREQHPAQARNESRTQPQRRAHSSPTPPWRSHCSPARGAVSVFEGRRTASLPWPNPLMNGWRR